jgi:PIN domain
MAPMKNIYGVLFIDANQYIDLYRTHTGKSQLAALKEQQDYIFVTEGVVDEVHRNKVREAAGFLGRVFKTLQAPKLAVPTHLFSTTDEHVQRIHDALMVDKDQIDIVNKKSMELADALLGQITRSEDEVSKALEELFAKPYSPSDDELNRARTRRERGSAPGKKSDPLGDQLNWEQICTHCQGKSKLWIITGDGDYATEYGRKMFLNAALYKDLSQRYQPTPEVFCFNNIPDGLKHFAEITKVTADNLPKPEQVEEIKKERDSLPPYGWWNNIMEDANLAAIIARSRRQMNPALLDPLSGQGGDGWISRFLAADAAKVRESDRTDK